MNWHLQGVNNTIHSILFYGFLLNFLFNIYFLFSLLFLTSFIFVFHFYLTSFVNFFKISMDHTKSISSTLFAVASSEIYYYSSINSLKGEFRAVFNCFFFRSVIRSNLYKMNTKENLYSLIYDWINGKPIANSETH